MHTQTKIIMNSYDNLVEQKSYLISCLFYWTGICENNSVKLYLLLLFCCILQACCFTHLTYWFSIKTMYIICSFIISMVKMLMGMVYSIMLPLMTLTLLSVYCLFYYVVGFDFMPINVTIVYQFLPMDSEND